MSNFFCVSQNNFISGTVVDSVDEYVFVLYCNWILILHYLSLERIVCYSIRLSFLRFCEITESWTLHWTFLVVSQQRKHCTSVKLIKINSLSINITKILCKLLTRIKNNQLVEMSKWLETQDLVVRSSDFRMEKSALECPLWIVVLHLRYNKKKKEKLVISL